MSTRHAPYQFPTGRIVVLGAAGQLGMAMVQVLAARGEVVALTRNEVDLTRAAGVRAAVCDHSPGLIVNCAAYNNVDGAEDDPSTALAVNGVAVGVMARAAAESGAAFVHYSTDFVFDGTASRPYTEDDVPEPKGVYAQSKLMGEWLAADAPRHHVLRVESLFGGPQARGSIDRIAAAVRAGDESRVFADRTVTPSYVDDVVAATIQLLERQAPAGVYHCVNTGVATWFDVATEIARLLDAPDARLTPVSVRDVAMRASRPQYAALDNGKLSRAGVAMPSWQDAIARYLRAR